MRGLAGPVPGRVCLLEAMTPRGHSALDRLPAASEPPRRYSHAARPNKCLVVASRLEVIQ